MIEEPGAFSLVLVKPIHFAPFIGENPLQITDGKRFHRGAALRIPKTPNGIHVVVFREDLRQLR
jgi:hypothetical protein